MESSLAAPLRPLDEGVGTSMLLPPAALSTPLTELFDRYLELGSSGDGCNNSTTSNTESEPALRDAGLLQFACDLGVEPHDIVMLIILWKLNSRPNATKAYYSSGVEITRSKFVGEQSYFSQNNLITLADLRSHLPILRNALKDSPSAFKDFYEFCFFHVKTAARDGIDMENAAELWRMLLIDVYPQCGGRIPRFLDDWCNFIIAVKSMYRYITRDIWQQFLLFCETCQGEEENEDDDDGGGDDDDDGEPFPNYDGESEAWPSLIDDFVEFTRFSIMREKKMRQLQLQLQLQQQQHQQRETSIMSNNNNSEDTKTSSISTSTSSTIRDVVTVVDDRAAKRNFLCARVPAAQQQQDQCGPECLCVPMMSMPSSGTATAGASVQFTTWTPAISDLGDID